MFNYDRLLSHIDTLEQGIVILPDACQVKDEMLAELSFLKIELKIDINSNVVNNMFTHIKNMYASLTDIDYADNICAYSDTIHNIRLYLLNVERELSEVVLYAN